MRGLSVGATGNISSQVRNAIVRTKQAQVFQYSITQQGNEAYDKYGDVSSQTNSYRSVSTYQYMYGKMYVDWERQFGMHGVKASLWGRYTYYTQQLRPAYDSVEHRTES